MEPAVRGRMPRRVTIRAQLRDLAVAIGIALLVFTGAFAAHRNAGLETRQIDGARRTLAWALISSADARPAFVPGATLAFVSAPEPMRHAFLSRRTVETHVQHILTKLGLSNRTQIATWVAGLRTTGT